MLKKNRTMFWLDLAVAVGVIAALATIATPILILLIQGK